MIPPPDPHSGEIDAALAGELVAKAGVAPPAAARVAEELRAAAADAAKALARELGALGGGAAADIVTVSGASDDAGGAVVVRHAAGTELRLSRPHHEKMRALWHAACDDEGAADDDEAFARALFCVLLRYKACRGGGFHAALGARAFAALRAPPVGARFEGFASPLNCRYARFCSAFVDVDAPFGSLGSWFGLAPRSGSFELNPPFVEPIVLSLCDHLETLLASADARGDALTFAVVVGANAAARAHAAWRRLTRSPFARSQTVVPLHEHGYFEGHQHLVLDGASATRLATCDTAVVVLQSARAFADAPADDGAVAAVADGLRAAKPARLTKTPKRFKQRAAEKRRLKKQRSS